jgi:hypothetical protein
MPRTTNRDSRSSYSRHSHGAHLPEGLLVWVVPVENLIWLAVDGESGDAVV